MSTFEIKNGEFTYNPDYIDYCGLPDEDNVKAWFITDAGPEENENGVYVYYRLPDHPDYARGFQLLPDDALKLFEDLRPALRALGVKVAP